MKINKMGNPKAKPGPKTKACKSCGKIHKGSCK